MNYSRMQLTEADRQTALEAADALEHGKPCKHCTSTHTGGVACAECVTLIMSFAFAMGVIESENGNAKTEAKKPTEKEYLQ